MPTYTLNLIGPVRLIEKDGLEKTPSSLKARGILALLGTAQHMRMSRPALTDKMWSTRSAKQGSDSLRQDIGAIRSASQPEILITGNGWVELSGDHVNVDISPASTASSNAEFCADLDAITDPEFTNWLRDMRAQIDNECVAEPKSPAALTSGASFESALQMPVIAVGSTMASDPALQIFGDMLLQESSSRAAELCGADLATDPNPARLKTVRVSCRVLRDPQRVIVQPEVRSGQGADGVWSQKFSAPVEALSDVFSEAASAATVAIVSFAMAKPVSGSQSALAGIVPFADIFGFDEKKLRSADALLSQQYTETGKASLLALRAFVHHTLIMERFDPDEEALRAEADRLVREALQQAPQSALVLAMASLIAGVQHQDLLALELAQQACRADPDHALARHGLSVALSFNGDPEAAHREAMRARESRMSILTPAISYLRNAYTSIGIGDQEQALKWSELACGIDPDFRAAHRVVAALRYSMGDEAGALDSLRKLKALEPDFSLELMESEYYPVDTLRAAGLLKIVRSGLL